MLALLCRALLLFLALFAAAGGLLCFVLACRSAMAGAAVPTVGWLALAALGALGVVYIPALGGASLWQPPERL
jgi:MYXO-CTERM domain-containing protein